MTKRILMVDDEPRNLALLEGLLGPLGHALERAANGREALAMIAAARPDLVLLDLVMPGLDGLDVLSHLRARPETRSMPVILVTAHGEREQRLRGLEHGADDFLEKPIDGAVLLRRVGRLLELQESREALGRSNEELAQRNEALRRLQAEQRELMGFVVHDLKNPLAALWANLHFALEDLGDREPQVREALDDACEATRRVRAMIDDLLAVSRLEDSQHEVTTERIVLGDLLHAIAGTFEAMARDRQVTVVVAPVSGLAVDADRRLLRRAIENIVENSLRYTPRDGRVALGAKQDAGGLTIAVSNDGPPIVASERARIFEKFARGEREQRTRSNAGLGLYFCKRAIEALGGRIEVTQTPEWPTSFLIHLRSPVPWP